MKIAACALLGLLLIGCEDSKEIRPSNVEAEQSIATLLSLEGEYDLNINYLNTKISNKEYTPDLAAQKIFSLIQIRHLEEARNLLVKYQGVLKEDQGLYLDALLCKYEDKKTDAAASFSKLWGAYPKSISYAQQFADISVEMGEFQVLVDRLALVDDIDILNKLSNRHGFALEKLGNHKEALKIHLDGWLNGKNYWSLFHAARLIGFRDPEVAEKRKVLLDYIQSLRKLKAMRAELEGGDFHIYLFLASIAAANEEWALALSAIDMAEKSRVENQYPTMEFLTTMRKSYEAERLVGLREWIDYIDDDPVLDQQPDSRKGSVP